MELIKKNIHMNKLKCKSSVQLTLDDDFNVPDVKPDIDKIVKEQGEIKINEVKAMNGKVLVKGSLHFHILYISDDRNISIHNMVGEIPFEEVINMDDINQDDNVSVKWELEDLTTSLINSRKISVRSIVSLNFCVEDIYDEETAVSVDGEEEVESKNKIIDITQIAINKKDTHRIKDEITIPSNKPNMFEILYSEARLENMDHRILDNKISLKGEVAFFILYSSEEEDHQIQYLDLELPFSGVIDCSGASEDMVDDIDISILSKDLEIKPDSDGEERVIDVEVVLDLDIKAYEEEQLEILSDVYSTQKELTPTVRDAFYENLVVKNNSKARVSDRIKLDNNQARILQICHSSATAKIDEMEYVQNGIAVDGVLYIQMLYITDDDNKPLGSLKGVIPFSQTIEAKEINENSIYNIKPSVEQLSVIMLDSEEVEVKASVNLNTLVFDKIKEPIITDVVVADIDVDKLQEIPSIVGYIVKPGDSLWNIAKKYYTTVDNIKEVNELEHDTIKTGDKILIIKKVDIAFS
ncbi:DUF3794 and LysM peptidoglycan-binding domain-containing protein [Anaeromicropila herbilytica]|uniref:Peptidase M23 n=1 Tax=Anaeromicropila herbilytica TaxID=2785025 RepID=A0A7R7ICC9_9FIRM|nr:SPOCS domain-containing protein [Anaeromicropila herbilytica]BCN28808.1 peptidase M23 [Anaeromicropila herbilytica]